jgi:O-antigen/teichoic acid export membrane protein
MYQQDFSRGPRKQPKPPKPPKQRKQFILIRIVNGWWDRLLGAVSDGSFGGQQEIYAAHRTTRDFIWNTLGFATWGMVFPLLTIVATQLVGIEQAGMFSLAFVTANLLMILSNYGVRSFQVSDIEEKHSFSAYQANRWMTCIFTVIVGIVYCMIRGYSGEMFAICIGLIVYKVIDGLADVYEGRLQQVDKLYLGGVSQTIRSVAVFAVSCICLLITRNLVVTGIAMAVVAGLSFVIITFPLALLETPKSRKSDANDVLELFKQCFPLFAALFLYALVDNMPKFVMDGVLDYDSQLYFNALYFPAQAILLIVGFIYRPLLVRMANAWADVKHRRRFDVFVIVILAIVVAITVAGILVMNWIGIPIMSFLYGVDFSPYANLAIIMLVAGGVTGCIDFLYQVVTVLRRQGSVTKLYIITFGFSLLILLLLVPITGLPGAVIGYLIVMTILLVLLAWEYLGVRIEYARNPEVEIARSHEQRRASTTLASPRASAAASASTRYRYKRLNLAQTQAQAQAQAQGQPQPQAQAQPQPQEQPYSQTPLPGDNPAAYPRHARPPRR